MSCANKGFDASMDPRAKAAGFEYHDLRADWYNWEFSVRAAVRANLIPPVSHTNLELNNDLLGMLLDAGVPPEKLPPHLRGLRRVDTSIKPITRVGMIKEAQIAAADHSSVLLRRVSHLASQEERELVKQHPAELAAGDHIAIYRKTGGRVRTSRAQLMHFAEKLVSRERIQPLLMGRGIEVFKGRLHTGGGSHAPPSRPMRQLGAVVSGSAMASAESTATTALRPPPPLPP